MPFKPMVDKLDDEIEILAETGAHHMGEMLRKRAADAAARGAILLSDYARLSVKIEDRLGV